MRTTTRRTTGSRRPRSVLRTARGRRKNNRLYFCFYFLFFPFLYYTFIFQCCVYKNTSRVRLSFCRHVPFVRACLFPLRLQFCFCSTRPACHVHHNLTCRRGYITYCKIYRTSRRLRPGRARRSDQKPNTGPMSDLTFEFDHPLSGTWFDTVMSNSALLMTATRRRRVQIASIMSV